MKNRNFTPENLQDPNTTHRSCGSCGTRGTEKTRQCASRPPAAQRSIWLIECEDQRSSHNALQVTRAELDTFRLDPSLIDALATAYHRYLDYLGAMVPPANPAQQAHDRCHVHGYGYVAGTGKPLLVAGLAVHFMVDICGLPSEQCIRFDAKVAAAEQRLGMAVACRRAMIN